MKKFPIALALVAGGLLVSQASAALTFSNIQVTGPAALVGTPTITTGAFDIDVAFNANAGVTGDPTGVYNPIAVVVISYDVASNSGIMTQQVLSLLGAAAGSGSVSVSTAVNTLPLPGTLIGSNVLAFNAVTPPPVSFPIVLSPGSASFHVAHTITFSVTNGAGFDLAQLGLVESHFVPAPGALALLGLGGVVVGRRRR